MKILGFETLEKENGPQKRALPKCPYFEHFRSEIEVI